MAWRNESLTRRESASLVSASAHPGRRSGRHKGSFPLIVAWCFGVILTGAAPALSADPPRLGLTSSDGVLWVVHRRAEKDGQLLLHLASRRAEGAESESFQPLLNAGLQGAAVRIAALGDSLHVIYRDGTHRRYVRPLRPWEAIPGKVQHTELVLPRSSVPAALAADAGRSALFAVLATRLARDLSGADGLLEDLPKQAEPLRIGETAVPQSSGAASENSGANGSRPGTHWPDTDFVVLRYANGRWAYDRPGPADATASAEVVLLAARDGLLHLFYRPDRQQAEFVAVRSSAPDQPWSSPQALPLPDVPGAWGGGWSDGRPLVLYALRRDREWRVSALSEGDERWVAGWDLVDQSGRAASFETAPAMAVFAGQAVVAEELPEPEHEVRVGYWSAESGKPTKDPVPIRSLRPSAGNGSRPTRMLVEYAVIGALVASLFLWQRGRVFQVVPLPPGLQLAPIVVRIAAALIDALLLLPFWSLGFYALWTMEGFTLADLADGGAAWSAQQSSTRDLLLPLCGAIYALYGTIFESTLMATPGKRIWGLAVLGTDSRPSSFAAILVRNAARIVEFEMVPLFVLIGLTPNRQRLGDLLSGTIVVSAGAAEATEDPSASEDSTER